MRRCSRSSFSRCCWPSRSVRWRSPHGASRGSLKLSSPTICGVSTWGDLKVWPVPSPTSIEPAAVSIICNAAGGVIFMNGLIRKHRRSTAFLWIEVRRRVSGDHRRSTEDHHRDHRSMIVHHATRRTTTGHHNHGTIQPMASCVRTRHRDATEFYRRTSLLTLNGEVIAGRPGLSGLASLKRDVVVDARTVAVVAVMPLPRPAEAADLQLLRTLRFDILTSAALAVVGALLLALLIATLFARRIKAVGFVATRIASGDLAARAPADGADELARLGADLNRMAVALETQEGMRRRWLANVAHELRTPLTVLRGEVEALQDGVRVVTPQALQSLADEVVHLGRIADDLHLLAMDDLDALPVAFTEVDVAALAARAVERWAAAATRAGLQLTVLAPAPAWAMADASRLQQVLDNLIANSVRYTDSPGRIAIQISATTASVILSVDDSAPGVPQAKLAQLFEPLYRVDPERSREKGGSGLGLAVCRAIVRSLRGEIRATPSPLGGLRVAVSLPRVVSAVNQ